jgi:hypothetical protein
MRILSYKLLSLYLNIHIYIFDYNTLTINKDWCIQNQKQLGAAALKIETSSIGIWYIWHMVYGIPYMYIL